MLMMDLRSIYLVGNDLDDKLSGINLNRSRTKINRDWVQPWPDSMSIRSSETTFFLHPRFLWSMISWILGARPALPHRPIFEFSICFWWKAINLTFNDRMVLSCRTCIFPLERFERPEVVFYSQSVNCAIFRSLRTILSNVITWSWGDGNVHPLTRFKENRVWWIPTDLGKT